MADTATTPTLEKLLERLKKDGAKAALGDVDAEVLRAALDHDDADVVAALERELEARDREDAEAEAEAEAEALEPPAFVEPPDPRDPDAALIAALAHAQGAFPTIRKGHTANVPGKDGKTGYSYSYADLGDVLAAVRPILAANGLAISQHTAHKDNGGKVLLLTRLAHVAGGELTTEVELGQQPGNPQQFGGALTYLRRYSIVTLLGIAAEEDLDAAHVEPARNGSSAPREVAPAWAAPLTNDAHKAELVDRLAEVIGHRDTAKRYAATLAAKTGGSFPAVVAAWLGALPHWVEAGGKAAVRDRQAAAEQPDPPGPTGEEPDPPAPEDPYAGRGGVPAGDSLTAGIERAEAAGADDPDAPPANPPGDELFPPDGEEPTAEELEASAAAAERAAPGTVELPPLDGADLTDLNDRDRARTLYRQHGCICDEPLALALKAAVDDGRLERDDAAARSAYADDATDTACPLKRHGIPF